MTAYDTTYNRDLAQSQRLYDYANIKNDTQQYNMGPTHQGGGMSGGMNCGMGRPFSDVARGMGMSGGVRRGAELCDVASPSGQFSVVPGRQKANGSGMSGGGQSGGKRPHLVKGSAEAKAYMASIRKKKSGNGAGVYGMPELLGRTTQALEGRGGTDGFPSGFKDNNPLAMAGGRKRGRGMSGGAVPLKQQLVGILDDRTLGNGMSGGGMSGGDFWSDFGDGFMSVIKPVAQVVGAIAPFLGAGQSGGNSGISSELALMSGSAPLQEAFLGGRKPSDVPRDEKVMLMKKALADYAIMKQLKAHMKASHGRGMSGGGKLTITHGAGMRGGDDMGDFFQNLTTLGSGMSGGDGLANDEMDSLVDTDFTGAGMSGGALSYQGNMAMADAMGDIFAGMGNPRAVGCGMSGGANNRCCDDDVIGGKRPRLVKGSAEAKAYMASIRNKKGRGMCGSGIMEPAVSAEVGQPRYSYGNMADTAGKSNVGSGGSRGGTHRLRLKPQMYGTSMTGSGLSGGDFWSDLGGVAQNLLPLLPLLL